MKKRMISTKRIKIVLPLVIAIFLLTLVAGCGSKTPTDSGNVNPPAEKQESGDKSLAELFAKTGEIKGMSFDCISTLPGGSQPRAAVGQSLPPESATSGNEA